MCALMAQHRITMGFPCISPSAYLSWSPRGMGSHSYFVPCQLYRGDDFQQNSWIAKSLQKQLVAMPFLHGAADEFISSLAVAIEPRLFIAGQEIFISNKDMLWKTGGCICEIQLKRSFPVWAMRIWCLFDLCLPWCYGCGQEDGADLYFVFEGHFHCLQKGAVVGTISPGMLFGILEVFGISDLSQDMRIRLVGWTVGWQSS